MNKYKRQIIILLVSIIAVFGFTFKTLVDRNNRNKELAKQMHSESIIKAGNDFNEDRSQLLKDYKINSAMEVFDKSDDIKIGGIITDIRNLHVIVRMDTADGSTYYNVEIPHTLKAYMTAMHVNDIVSMTVIAGDTEDGMVQAQAKEIKLTKKAGK
ncbi:hypothetical protein GND98_017580 [Clostridium butyricum]|uniref:Uncharacterized protein n=1 Tax=Clostridium butyricum TaxID=1492 RepID=A0A6L9ETG2_CLOBU|nr:hypothetical protein [Clostridium butyricum]